MWIKGEWYLTGSVEDDSGISSFKLDGKELIGTDKLEAYETPGTYSNYNLKIPVGSSTGYDSISYSLTAFEGAADRKSTVQEIKLNYDNEAPDFTCTTLSDTGNKIYQSDGVYEIKGTFKEESSAGKNQSGFDRIAFYFTRTIGGKTYIIDPMLVKGSDGKANRYDVASTTGLEKDSSDGMYWRKVENCTISNGKEISVPSIPDNVRAGGLCKINNVIYRIENVSGSTRTITVSSTLSSADSVTVYFAIAQIIDNTIRETGKTTFYGDSTGSGAIINDDGDGMVESYSETSGEWTVAINSQNILDGPIDIHFVAFDKAGNKTSSSYSGTVSNNTPRIAGIRLGTDLNGNNVVDNDELITVYSGLYDTKSDNKITGVSVNGQKPNGEKVTSIDISDNGNAVMTIKGRSKFIPEIVGGNTSLGWSYAVDSVKHPFTKFTSAGHSDSDDVRDTATTTIELTMVDFLKDKVTDGENKKFTFSIWDETEGFTSGSDSQHADFNIVMNVAIQDKAKPTVHIKPFYWNSRTDNSIYKSDGSLKGHIELESDWKQTDSYKNNGTSAVYDGDPKVSGIILIEGVAEDNVILEKLEMCFPGLNNSSDYVTVAERNNGEWKSTLTLADNGIKFEIVEELFDNVSGNTLSYRIAVDTEKIKDVAKTDVQVRMRATDRGSASLSGNSVEYTSQNKSAEDSDSTTSENLSSYYRIDVVPYITGVETSLSTIKETNPSVYSRNSIGHYPVWYHKDSPNTDKGTPNVSSETVNIYGFNLDNGIVYNEGGSTGVNTNEGMRIKNSNIFGPAGTKYYSVSVENLASKGIEVKVSGVPSLNNSNSTTAEYNKQSNNDNNLNLQDDVIFDVWQLNSKAARPEAGGNDVTSVAMAVNPSSQMLNFAFSNGSIKMSFANGKSNSYQLWSQNWDDYIGNTIVTDSTGNTFGTTIGQDTNANNQDGKGESSNFNIITSLWSPSTFSSEYEYKGTSALRLEKLGFWGYADSSASSKSQIINKRRIQAPSPVIVSHDGTNTMYLAYCDIINSQVRFRYGDIGNNKDNNGQLVDINDTILKESNIDYWSVVAGYSSSCETDSNRNLVNGYHSGKFVAIDVIPGSSKENDVVVLVWYDADVQKLMYTYKKNPCNDYDAAESNYGKDGYWAKPIVIFEGAGEYCKIKVDSDNGIHIAAYDTVNADVVYAYLSSYEARSVTGSCTVDSADILGTYLTLEVAKSNGKQIPYIGYYANSIQRPKFAKLSENAANPYDDGVIDNAYTGNWEVSIVPTTSRMVEGTINVGIWKNGGELINSKEGSSYSATNTGICYGNGTSNAVLGYAITNQSGTGGTIETAQLK